MSRRRVRPYNASFVTVPRRREPPVISIRELRWNARLGVVSQLAYLAGKLPRQLRLVLGVVALGALWMAVELAVAFWPLVVVLVAAWLLWRYGRPRWAAWRQYRRDRAEALEVFGDDDETPTWPNRGDDIPY